MHGGESAESRQMPARIEEKARHGYDAFISYSHALDGKLAPTLQLELERFAKPWYRMRALRVFRDNANLSASPGLWSSIERALSSSKWLILMASPEAASSPWVNRELSWWLTHRSSRHILLVVTSGEFIWDEKTQDVNWAGSTAAPNALHGAFDEEPRWVDLRWLREAEHANGSNPRLRECVADIAAAVRGVPKDSIIGEHIRRHRTAIRLAWAGSMTLALLLVLSLISGVIAVVQRNEAREQRNEAQEQARIATSRALAAESDTLASRDPILAGRLAIAAYRLYSDGAVNYRVDARSRAVNARQEDLSATHFGWNRFCQQRNIQSEWILGGAHNAE